MRLTHFLLGLALIHSQLVAQAVKGSVSGDDGSHLARPRAELARAAKRIDDAMEQMRALLQTLEAARDLAKSAESQGKAVEAERLVVLASELQARIGSCMSDVQSGIDALDGIKGEVATEIPQALIASKIDALRNRIVDCEKSADLLTAEKQVQQIEVELSAKDAVSLVGGEWLLGFARYRHGEIKRQRAALHARKGTASDNSESIKTLKNAVRVFESVLETPDVASSGEGSSLHAVALLRVVQINASLFDAYSRAKSKEAQPFRAKAEESLDLMKRRHADARLATGEGVVELAEAKVRELVR